MTPDLSTTNVLLGIMAVVSLLEAFAMVAVFVGILLLYRRATRAIGRFEARQVAPVTERINGILDDVRGVTSTAKEETERIFDLLHWAFNLLRRRRPGGGTHPTPDGR